MHQLGQKLTNKGIIASLLYYGDTDGDPVHPAYKDYSVPYVFSADDSPENVLIVPEVKTGLVQDYNRCRKIIWWLSVDNFFRSMGRFPLVKKALSPFIKKYRAYDFSPCSDLYHLVQSAYAEQFLLSKNIPPSRIAYLSDYLNRDFLAQSGFPVGNKKDWVAYNPRKGAAFTRLIIEHNPDIEWKAIENMSREEVIGLLRQAKVYIDFGEHPGKDRIPREAAISGCCVITGKKGSAAFSEDVAIPEKYKFQDVPSSIPDISSAIRKCLVNYDEETKKFESYRDRIRAEESRFDSDLSSIFVPA